MKIAVSGTSCSGKSTLIREFINTFKMYKTPAKTYRDRLKAEKINHSSKTCEETQKFILDYMIDQLTELKDEKYIIYDRCPLDVLVYTVLAAEANQVSEEFLVETIQRVRDSLSLLDVIFICPFDDKIKIIDNGTRDTDINYIKKVDPVFQNLMQQYYTDFEADVFFPVKDCPGIINLENLNNRLGDIKIIINPNGDLYSAEDDKNLQAYYLGGNQVSKADKTRGMMKSLIERQEFLLPRTEIEGL